MALNIKNAEVEALVNEVSAMSGESKTESVRRALEERRDRLRLRGLVGDRARRRREFMRSLWAQLPPEILGNPPMSKEEEEALLGLDEHRK